MNSAPQLPTRRRWGISAAMACLTLAALAVNSGSANALGWSIQKVPGVGGILYGVSCSSTRACTAVGDSAVLRWNGSTWMKQMTPTPPDTRALWLGGVSCPSNRACVAVGSVLGDSTGNWQPVGGRWLGKSWRFQLLPAPANRRVEVDSLHAVSCSSSSACTAVGYTPGSAGRELPFVERWDGSRWSLQTSAWSASATFWGVSCSSSRSCVAVGDFAPNGGDNQLPLSQHWDGRSWSTQRFPRFSDASLRGVWCKSSGFCLAVGYGPAGTLAARWNGSGWSIQLTPGGAATSLSAVSCSSSTACTAVGGTSTGPLAERWEGGVWSIQRPIAARAAEATPAPNLDGVSCPSRTICTAVGFRFTGDYRPLIERWTGPLVPQVTG